MAKRVKAGTSKAAASTRKALFAKAYLANGMNGVRAALTAGYKPGVGASKAAARMSCDVFVQRLIAEGAEKTSKIAGLSVERTLAEIARLAYSDPRRFYDEGGNLIPVHKLDDDTAATVAAVEIEELSGGTGKLKKIKHWDKNAALEKAMKYHGLYEKDNSQKRSILQMTDDELIASIAAARLLVP